MLFRKISEVGCLISEYPPGTEPRPWQFPERNRIISGLSNGVLVAEAPKNSGALITAREAMSQGRDVFAVPGNVGNPNCEGSNALLEDGASVALSGWGIMKEYEGVYPCVAKRSCVHPIPDQEPPLMVAQHISYELKPEADKKVIDNSASGAYIDRERILAGLDPFSRTIVEALGPEPIPIDDLIAMVEAPPNQVLGTLTMLALSGVVENHPGRLVSLKH
jgi:DNA processing protein